MLKVFRSRVWLRRGLSLPILFLFIEFFDEFAYAVEYTALPVFRVELGLTYAQVGLLLGLPGILNIFIEPVLMLLGDTALRKRLVLAGGICMSCGLLLIASVQSFPPLLIALIVIFPASGAFVSLSQATLMDLNPGREAHWMARWTVAGSLANLVAPLLMAGGFALGMSWRWGYVAAALGGACLVVAAWNSVFPPRSNDLPVGGPLAELTDLLRGLWDTLQNLRLLRWVALLDLADLLMDIFTGYSALYFADVVGLNESQTGLVLSLLMLASLAGDLVLLPLLDRIPGRTLVRVLARCALVLYPAFLLVPWPWAKIVLACLLRFSTLGWYPIMEGEAYAAAPGRSGTVSAIGSLSGLLVGGMTAGIGWVAEQAGLSLAMWLLLLGPLALVLGVPKAQSTPPKRW